MSRVFVSFDLTVWTEPDPQMFSFPCPHEVTQIYSRVIDFSQVGGLITIIFDAGIYSHSHLQRDTLSAFYHVVIQACKCSSMLCHLLLLSSWKPTLSNINIQSHAQECRPRHSHIHRLMSRTSHLEFKTLYMQIKTTFLHVPTLLDIPWTCPSTTTLGGGSKCNPL